MATICQFHQTGHCKFADKCVKIHTSATCDSFPCQDRECPKRHPRMCKYYAMYGRCVYAERCSFLHFSFSGGEQTAGHGVHAIEQEVYELREEVKNLREEVKHMLGMVKDLKEEIDVDRVRKQGNDREEEIKSLLSEIIRLRKETDTHVNTQNENSKQLFEMIKDIREDLNVERAVRWQNDSEIFHQQVTWAENEGHSVTCLNFPCMNNTCIKHYTEEEGNIRKSVSQAARVREGALGNNRRMLERTGNKRKKGKPVTPGMSKSKFWAPGSNNDPGRGHN